ncbi:hypothetical protein EJ08DRAFT_661689 [Tothia fuscella]|uniref:F-box domain-containing protein n=1 Tax=Tothia fuscella TaxID=1048955 RepID=A0A9P4TXL3_9PEZI|nr:hypothetical protein EJ08DRAFT_661689 [Tothia fuscella]
MMIIGNITPQTNCAFFKLPVELRSEVYSLTTSGGHASENLAFLATCKQIYSESASLAWSNTTFHLKPSTSRESNLARQLVELAPELKINVMAVKVSAEFLPKIAMLSMGGALWNTLFKRQSGLLVKRLPNFKHLLIPMEHPMTPLNTLNTRPASRDYWERRGTCSLLFKFGLYSEAPVLSLLIPCSTVSIGRLHSGMKVRISEYHGRPQAHRFVELGPVDLELGKFTIKFKHINRDTPERLVIVSNDRTLQKLPTKEQQ